MISISLKPEELFSIAGFSVSNSFLATIFVSILLMLVFGITARRMKPVPGKLQLMLEMYVTWTREFVLGMTNDEKATNRIFPLFATIGIFFLLSNLIGFLPGLSAISVGDTPLYRAPTTDYALIFTITMISFLIWQMVAIVTGGLFGYIGKFLNFKSPMDFIMGLLDIIGEAAKIISLSFRLFGNIFAGEVIAIVLLNLVPYIAPLPFAILGLLSSVIQAFVFPILVVIFISMSIAVKKEREEEPKTDVPSNASESVPSASTT